MKYFLVLLCLFAPLPAAAKSQADEDKGYLTELIEENLSGVSRDVSIIGFEGALSSNATIDVLTVSDADGVWLTLEDIVLIWSRSALLRGAIDVQELSVARIIVARPPVSEAAASVPSAEATPFTLPEFPVSITLDQLDIAEIILSEAFLGEEITVSLTGAAALGGGKGTAEIVANRLGGTAGVFEINGAYANENRILDLLLNLEEGADGIAARILDLPGRPQIRLRIEGDAPIDDYRATIKIATDGEDRLSGAFASQDIGAEKRISLDLIGDISPLFNPEYQGFFGTDAQLFVAAVLSDTGRVDIPEIAIDAGRFTLAGAILIGTQGWPELIDLTGAITPIANEAVLLPFSGPKTYVNGAQIAISYDAQLADDWRADISTTGFDRLGLTIESLDLRGCGILQPGEGELVGQVTANLAYGATGVGFDDAGAGQAFGDKIEGVFTAARTESEATRISQFTLQGAGIDIDASGTIAGLKAGFQTAVIARFEASGLDRFSTLVGQQLGGSAVFDLQAAMTPLDGLFSVTLSGQTDDLSVGIAQADAVFAGSGNIAATALRDTDGTRLETLRVQTPAATVSGSANFTNDLIVAQFTARLRDIGLVFPELSGAATVSGDISRTADGMARISVNGTGPASRFNGDATINPAETGQSINGQILAEVTDLSRYAALVGQPISGGISMTASGDLLPDLSRFDLNIGARSEDLNIANPTVDPLLAGVGRLNADIGLADGVLAVRTLELSTPQLSIVGALNGASGFGQGRFNASLRDVGVLTDQISGSVRATGSGSLDETGNWGIDATVTGPGGLQADISGQVSQALQMALHINGVAPLALANAAIDPRRLSGTAQFDIGINGPPALILVSGRVTFADGRLTAPTLRQALSDIEGQINLTGTAAQFDLRAGVEGGGNLTIRGPVGLTESKQADLTFAFNDVVQRDPKLYSTTVNGEITINGSLDGEARIAGRLALGQTDIQVPSSGVSSLGELPSVVHLGPTRAVQETLLRAGVGQSTASIGGGGATRAYPLDIVVDAPSRIFIRGRGLDAELSGQLIIGGTTANVVPVGRFELVRGRIDILQQRFDLTEGSATMRGDFDPFLRLVATTETAGGTTINIILEGPADAPEVTFESIPELPQDEVLSQLIFGRDLQSISPLQAVQLVAAMSTLAGKGGGAVDRLRQNIGLDDFDVTTDEEGNAALRAGKYLSDNVYTDVTITIDGSTEINLNLDITDEIIAKVSVEQDGETSVGVFFERDY